MSRADPRPRQVPGPVIREQPVVAGTKGSGHGEAQRSCRLRLFRSRHGSGLEGDRPVVQGSRGTGEPEVVDELGAVDAPVLQAAALPLISGCRRLILLVSELRRSLVSPSGMFGASSWVLFSVCDLVGRIGDETAVTVISPMLPARSCRGLRLFAHSLVAVGAHSWTEAVRGGCRLFDDQVVGGDRRGVVLRCLGFHGHFEQCAMLQIGYLSGPSAVSRLSVPDGDGAVKRLMDRNKLLMSQRRAGRIERPSLRGRHAPSRPPIVRSYCLSSRPEVWRCPPLANFGRPVDNGGYGRKHAGACSKSL